MQQVFKVPNWLISFFGFAEISLSSQHSYKKCACRTEVPFGDQHKNLICWFIEHKLLTAISYLYIRYTPPIYMVHMLYSLSSKTAAQTLKLNVRCKEHQEDVRDQKQNTDEGSKHLGLNIVRSYFLQSELNLYSCCLWVSATGILWQIFFVVLK